MEEPLSIAVSIIGLISFGSKLASLLHTYIDNVTTARIEIIETTKELESLCLVLRRLEQVYRPAEWDADLRDVLDSCRRIFVELEKITSGAGGGKYGSGECEGGLGGDTGWTRRWKKLMLMLGDAKDIDRLKSRLEAHKATLSITLLVSQFSKSSILESNERVERATQEVCDMLQESDDFSSVSGSTYRPSAVLKSYLSVGALRTSTCPPEPLSPTSITSDSTLCEPTTQLSEPPQLDSLVRSETGEQGEEKEPQISRKRKRISAFLHHTTKITLLSGPNGKPRKIHTFRCPLHVAASNGDESTVRALATGKNVNSAELYGLTPLQYAASRGHASIVRYLISAGAHVNVASSDLGDSPSPLAEACEYGHLETVRALLAAGADVHAANPLTGASCLYLAARTGSEGIVKELLARGADVHKPDLNGRTPLHAGVQSGRRRVVRALLQAGAEAERGDSRGKTPFEVAWGMNWGAGVDILVKAGRAMVKF